MILNWEDSQDNIFMEKESWMYLKILVRKFLTKHLKKAAKNAATKAITTAATKTGEHVGEKAGDKIIEFLSRKKKTQKPKKVRFEEPVNSMSQQDRYQQLGRILSDD